MEEQSDEFDVCRGVKELKVIALVCLLDIKLSIHDVHKGSEPEEFVLHGHVRLIAKVQRWLLLFQIAKRHRQILVALFVFIVLPALFAMVFNKIFNVLHLNRAAHIVKRHL